MEQGRYTGELQATAWMMGALVSFTMMAVSGRELSAELNTFQILFFRSAASLVTVAVILCFIGWKFARTEQVGAHAVRNGIHFCAQYGWFLGITLLPLAQVVAIEFTTPIWVCLFAVPMLGEAITRWRAIAVALGFLGVLVVVRPDADTAVVNVGVLAVIGAAIGFAFTNINTKKLVRHDAPVTILFYMAIMQLPLGLVPSLTNWVWPSALMWPWIAVLGVSAMGAHYCFSQALKVAASGFVAPIEFLRLPLIAVVGFMFYGEAIDIWVLVGAALMVCGNLINIKMSR